MKLNSKPGLILSLSYFGIFLLSTIFVLSIMASSTGDASLAGAPLIALTFPWSVIMAPIMRLLSESLFQGEYYLFFTILSLLPAALINATILYFIGKSFDDVAKNKKTPHGSGATPSRDRVNGLWKKFNVFFWIFTAMSVIGFFLMIVLMQVMPDVDMQDAQGIKYFEIFFFFFEMIVVSVILGIIGNIITLSYFGYAITLKKSYILLGLFVLFIYFIPAVGSIVGYIILWRAKKKIIESQSFSTIS